jgi:uroporphyrinogen decarboxylase
MTPKERFVKALQFAPVDRAPLMEIAVWGQTRERWLQEGMPPTCNTGFMHRGDAWFGLEGYETVDVNVTGPLPAVEPRVLEENAETILFVDGMGRTRRALKTGTVGGTRLSMDTYLDFPVKDMASFNAFKWRYEGPAEARYPADWEAVRAAALATDLPLTLMNPLAGTFGYYSMLRNWMGTEALSYFWYDDPALLHACLDFLTDFALRTLERALREIPFDFVYIHEDMAGKGGPLMGPKLFREFLLPHYRRLVGFLKAHGIPLVLVDTDGDHEVLTPLFLEAGVNGFGPIERAAGMDPVDLRRRYGNAFCMLGGIDKRELAKDRAAIDREIDRAIRPLIAAGGFIPMIDHAVPPDVSLDNFRYYLERKQNAMLG